MKTWIAMIALLTTSFASAKVVDSGTVPVKAEILYVEMEVEARCRPPQYEDDTFTTYFSKASYAEVAKYLDKGYSFILIGRTCGAVGSSVELSPDVYETVNILLFDANAARSSVDSALGDLLNKYQ